MNKRCLKLIGSILIICLVFSAIVLPPAGAYAASKKPKYIAHRGLSAKAPENTLAAFSLASKYKKFYGVEFDVWESEDKSGPAPLLLVMHDPTTTKMCGIEAQVRSVKRAELNKYKITSGKNIRKYKNQTMPTVEQTLKTIWKNSRGAIPVIELKHRLSPEALDYLLTYLGKHKAVVISFDYDAVTDTIKLAKKKGIKKNITTMYLAYSIPADQYAATASKLKADGIDSISLKYTAINSKLVKAFHKKGRKVGGWTIPNKKQARKYAKMGVDYITSNGVVW